MYLIIRLLLLSLLITVIGCNNSVEQKNTTSTQENNQSIDSIKTENVTFESE